MTRIPLTFPPLVEMSERATPEMFAVPDPDAYDGMDTHGGAYTLWDDLMDKPQARAVAHVAFLLSDLVPARRSRRPGPSQGARASA